jgi:hypothetical protein
VLYFTILVHKASVYGNIKKHKKTFDKVDTEKMFECMRERRVSEGDISKNKKQIEGGRKRRRMV